MKKHLFLFITFLLFSVSFGQVQNIADLSTGIIEKTSRITDKDQNIIGYVFIFNKGLINQDKSVQYEYVLLDNNLNKLSNGDFDLPKFKKIEFRINDIEFNKQKLYITSILYHSTRFSRYGENLKVVDLKQSKVIEDKFYRDYTFKNMSEVNDFEKMNPLKTTFKNVLFTVPNTDKVYFLDIQSANLGEYEKLTRGITIYNQDFIKNIDFTMDVKKEKQGFDFEISTIKDNKLLLFQKKLDNTSAFFKFGTDYFITYDLDTGEEKAKSLYNSVDKNMTEYYLPNTEYVKDNLMVIGEIKPTIYQNIYNINAKPTDGIYRTVYDSLGNLLVEKKIYYEYIFKELGFKNGRDKDGFKFILKEYFNNNDSSFSILLVKQKGDNIMIAPRTTDYILVNFNEKGEFKNYKLLEKSKVKNIDTYLFSQENKEENEVLFFYAEELKENGKKEWFLTINKLKNGELTQQRMPFKTDSSTLRFGKAKYGYMYISEYNKDDKETSVRIEKLNI